MHLNLIIIDMDLIYNDVGNYLKVYNIVYKFNFSSDIFVLIHTLWFQKSINWDDVYHEIYINI